MEEREITRCKFCCVHHMTETYVEKVKICDPHPLTVLRFDFAFASRAPPHTETHLSRSLFETRSKAHSPSMNTSAFPAVWGARGY